MKGQKKKQNGITLIALVISIIVMLILAGVSINALMGDNGILRQAQYASFMSEMAAVEEAVQLWGAEHYDDENHAIPAKGMVQTDEMEKTERLLGEIGYYRTWSKTNSMPATSISTEASSFNSTFSGELVSYPGGIEDLYYLDNDGLNLTNSKKYVIDAVNSMIYSVQGISLNGVRCYSLSMAKAIMNGVYEAPSFASAEVSGAAKEKLVGDSKYKVDEYGRYIYDENGELIENEEYNDFGFRIIADQSNPNVYKLYNNGDLYVKGKKGYLAATPKTEMDNLDYTKWQKISIPNVIPNYNDLSKIQVFSEGGTNYVIDSNNDLWAWGNNSYNKLGLTSEQLVSFSPYEAIKLNVDNKKVEKIFPSGSALFVVTNTNGTYELYACGYNKYGVLGVGNDDETLTEFTSVDFENPEKINSMTVLGTDYYERFITTTDHKVFFSGNRSTGNVTKFEEIYTGEKALSFTVDRIYNLRGYGGYILSTEGTLYSMNGTTVGSEMKFEDESVKVLEIYSPGVNTLLKVKKADNSIAFLGIGADNYNVFGVNDYESYTWFEVSNDFPTGLTVNNIAEVCCSDSNVFYITNNGELYASGSNLGCGIGIEGGFASGIIRVKDYDNTIPKLSNFVDNRDKYYSKATGNVLVEDENNNIYSTGNMTLMFMEKCLQTNWKQIASNVKVFKACTGNTNNQGLGYIDNNNDLWVLGSNTKRLGINATNQEKQFSFIRIKDYLVGMPIYNNIDSKVIDYQFAGDNLFIRTNKSDNYTLYVCGEEKTESWYTYCYLGLDDGENAPIPTEVLSNVKQMSMVSQERLVLTYDDELYTWGISDGSAIDFNGRTRQPKLYELDENVSVKLDLSKVSFISCYVWHTYAIQDDELYMIGVGSNHSSGANGYGPWAYSFVKFNMQTDFGGKKIKSIASSNNCSNYIILMTDGSLYGWGWTDKIGIGSNQSNLQYKVGSINTISGLNYVVGGANFFVGIKEDGSVWATGDNSNGILGRWIGVDRNAQNSRYKTAYTWVECPELEI